MSGEVRDRSFGLLLYAMLGSVSSVNTDGAAWTHTFSLAASNQHASLSLVLVSPDETVFFRRCMLQAITITYELGGYVTFEAEWMAHASEDSAVQSASFSVENKFVTRMASVRFAANIAGLGAASETSVKRARITISKNLVRDDILGTIEPEDILNQQFGVEGELELNYENTTVKDFMTANTYRALRINAVDTNTTIGGSSNPTFRLDLPRVHFFDWEPQNALNEIRRQTVSFKGLYDLANSQNAIHQAVLINTATGY
ncbi:hypothetical protein HY492_00050 [Candidatus Woesearchaeota archaeon]|nr:hypothetical protein [Candidatus Woesearchaeota archaeon]